MRTCKKCGNKKELTDFYKCKDCTGGRDTTCKECRKAYQKRRQKRLRKDPDWVEKERRRSREKYYRLNYRDKYDSHVGDEFNTFRERYPEKYKAISASQRMPCPDGCSRHHWSYREEHFKDIIILENKTHQFVHRYLNYDREKKMFRTVGGRLLDTRHSHKAYLRRIIANADENELKIMMGNAA